MVPVSRAAKIATLPPEKQHEAVEREESKPERDAKEIRRRRRARRQRTRLVRAASSQLSVPLAEDHEVRVLLIEDPAAGPAEVEVGIWKADSRRDNHVEWAPTHQRIRVPLAVVPALRKALDSIDKGRSRWRLRSAATFVCGAVAGSRRS